MPRIAGLFYWGNCEKDDVAGYWAERMRTLSQILRPEAFCFEGIEVVPSAYLAANDLYFTINQASGFLGVEEAELGQFLERFGRLSVTLKIKPSEDIKTFESILFPSMVVLVAAVKFRPDEDFIVRFIGLLTKIRKLKKDGMHIMGA